MAVVVVVFMIARKYAQSVDLNLILIVLFVIITIIFIFHTIRSVLF